MNRISNWLDSMVFEKDGQVRYAVAAETPDQSSMNLYQGLPGILLFYHRLHEVTGEERYQVKSRQLANLIAEHLDQQDGSGDPGLFTGYTGLGWVLLKTYPGEHRDSILHCVELLTETAQQREVQATSFDGIPRNAVTWNQVTDVIGGSAGIGLFLVHCSAEPEINSEKAWELAGAAAVGLHEDAQRVDLDNGIGWKWMMSPTFQREMPNYSHGTAGICDFLLAVHEEQLRRDKLPVPQGELQTVYDGQFAVWAGRGANYLAALDTVHGARGLLPHHFPDGDELFYLGWCHGPAGTCQLANRLGAMEDQASWQDYSKLATDELVRAALHANRTDGFWNNVGICCGSAGVGSFLVDQSIRYENDDYLTEAKRIAEDILARGAVGETADGRPTLCWTQAEHRVRPEFLQTQSGLMQGAAGVGLFLIQLEMIHRDREPFSIFGDLMK
ncbi:MAG: lanthionine synthetase LanC family protein [Pirellulaceae bacterium]